MPDVTTIQQYRPLTFRDIAMTISSRDVAKIKHNLNSTIMCMGHSCTGMTSCARIFMRGIRHV